MNDSLTQTDLDELERIMIEACIGSSEDIERAKEESNGLGLFVRSLIGLDREAAKRALGEFLTGSALSANQIEFADLIVNHLTENGVMAAARLWESPFTDLSPHGPEGVFTSGQVGKLVSLLTDVRERAVA